MPGLAALAFKRLVICGDSSPMFGKYFQSQRNHKMHEKFLRKNSWNASLSARNFHALVDPSRPQGYQSNQLRKYLINMSFRRYFWLFRFHQNNSHAKSNDLRVSKSLPSPCLLHFHGFQTGLMKFFEEFAQKLHTKL